MTIVYQIDNTLYLNITNRCSCACTFCVRQKGEGIHGSDSLWLEQEPSAQEVIQALQAYALDTYDGIVFCGYGEPLLRLDVVEWVCRYLREATHTPIRINTNGLANLTYQTNVTKMLKGLVDEMSISLNAPDEVTYQKISRPIYEENAHLSVIQFAACCLEVGIKVQLSVVDEVLDEKQIDACREIADTMHIPLRVRKYL